MSNPNASPDEIAEDIEQIRERLGATIDELVYRAHPKTIANRQAEKTKAHFVDSNGSLRFENIVPIVTYSLVAVVGIVIVRKLLK